MIPATGHAWGEPTWNWTGTTAATASFVCGNDSSHTVTLDAAIREDVSPAGCETEGLRTFTATVTLEGLVYTDVKTKTIAATGHRYGEPEYTWIMEDESYTVIASVSCLNDPAHELVESVTAVYEVIEEPTERENGLGRYTAVFMDEHFTVQVKDVVLPKFGPDGYHIYVTDYTKARANISLDAEALYEGDVSFTVWAELACAVGIDNGDGTYTRLPCTTVDGEHRFSVTVTDEDVYLVLVFKGDEDLSGRVNLQDSTRIKRVMVDTLEATALERFAADVDGNERMETRDATYIARVMVGTYEIPW